MAEQKKVKVAMITGYLGAGKTTLLNHILSNTEGIRAAVIVNDIGEVNIDAEFIARSGAVTEVEDSLIPMTNGCICCSLSEDLAEQLRGLANSGDYDYIIIEASGICEPMPIAFTIQQFCEDTEEGDAPMALDNVIAVVDCARMFDEFNGGRDLVDEDEDDDITNLLIEQIEFCSTLILNKVDQVEPEQLAELKAIVRSLQKKAKVIEAVRGNVELSEVLDTDRFDFEEVMGSAGWMAAMEDEFDGDKDEDHDEHEHEHEHHHDHEHECEHHHHHDEECDDPDCCCHHHHDHEECDDPECECHEHGHHHHHHDGHCCCGHDHADGHDHVADFGITTFVYERRCPFTVDSLNEACEEWPESVIRCKGMVWLDDNPDMCCVFEQAGSRFYLSENGYWLAALDKREREQIIAEDPSVMDNWIDGIGDRRVKLVFIGKNMDQKEVEALFDSKLV